MDGERRAADRRDGPQGIALRHSHDSAQSAAAIFSLIAGCKRHGLEPEVYLRDALGVLTHWPKDRCLELAPLIVAATRARAEGADARALIEALLAVAEAQ